MHVPDGGAHRVMMLRAIARQLAPTPSAGQQEIVTDITAVAPPSPWHDVPMFVDGARGGLTPEQRAQMDIDGHIVLPGIISEETTARAIAALARVKHPVLFQVVHQRRALVDIVVLRDDTINQRLAS